jgi:hypothetical protein
MLRKVVGALVALVVCLGVVLADEAKGKVKKYEKGNLTVTVGAKDQNFKLTKETKVTKGKEEVKGKRSEIFKEGTEVTVIYDKKGDEVTVKEVQIK